MSYGTPSAEPSAQIPVCPRHPDRPSYVRCQRCGRPACPDCQRAAAVGFQCVDCVNESNRALPQVKTVYGGAAAGSRPLATFFIIGLCGLAYLLQWLIPNYWMLQQFAYAPAFTDIEPWRMITSVFLHSQSFIPHIFLNMYMLWIFGQALEPLLGRLRFFAVYLLSGIGGSVGFLLLTPVYPAGALASVAGASGAIFGLFGAMLVVQHLRGGDTRQLWVLMAINGVIGFIIPQIAWEAHLGGLVTGALCAAVIAHSPRGRRQGPLQAAGFAVIFALLVAASAIRMVTA